MVWKVRIPLYVFSWNQNLAFKKLYDCWCALSVRSRCLNIEIITLPSLARFSYRTFPAIMVPAQVPTGVGFLTFEWGAHSASVFTISRADVSKDYNLLGMGKSICASLLFIHTHIRPHTCWYPQLAFALLQRCFAPFWYELFGWSSTPDEPTVTVRLISVDCWPPIFCLC